MMSGNIPESRASSRRNRGRLQIGMAGEIIPERWARSVRNQHAKKQKHRWPPKGRKICANIGALAGAVRLHAARLSFVTIFPSSFEA